jgi:hypothetical protein
LAISLTMSALVIFVKFKIQQIILSILFFQLCKYKDIIYLN